MSTERGVEGPMRMTHALQASSSRRGKVLLVSAEPVMATTSRCGRDLVGPRKVSDEADLLAGRFLEQQVPPIGLLGAREAGGEVARGADGCHADRRLSRVPGH